MACSAMLDVVIVAAVDDLHAQCVAHMVRSKFGKECLVWDTSRLPAEDRATVELGGANKGFSLISDGRRYDLAAVKCIWWRRPQAPRIEPGVIEPRVREFCEEQTDRFFKGLISGLSATLINDPDAQSRANRKAVQLQQAQRLGLKVPETILTNDPDAVRRFVQEANGTCVYKVFRPPRWKLLETRLIRDDDLLRLQSLRHAPVIVQRYIPRGRDIRVTVINDRVFCAAAVVRRDEAAVDWRVDPAVTWEATRLPKRLESMLVAYVGRLGLHYGCIDLREDRTGEIYFLEINPSGQFLFLEVDAELPVVRAFAEMLCQPLPTE
jgi:hypothetical protein